MAETACLAFACEICGRQANRAVLLLSPKAEPMGDPAAGVTIQKTAWACPRCVLHPAIACTFNARQLAILASCCWERVELARGRMPPLDRRPAIRTPLPTRPRPRPVELRVEPVGIQAAGPVDLWSRVIVWLCGPRPFRVAGKWLKSQFIGEAPEWVVICDEAELDRAGVL